MINEAKVSVIDQEELAQTMRDLRGEMIPQVLIALMLSGFLSILGAMVYPDMLQGGVAGLYLFGLAGISWMLYQRSLERMGWFLAGGWLLLILGMAVWTGVGSILNLLIVPIGLIIGIIGLRMGFITTIGISLFVLWLPNSLLSIETNARWAAIGILWLFYFLMGLSLQPLITMTRWSWASYEVNRDLLEKVRDSNLQTQMAMKDLSDANLQLNRLNNLAHSLRLAAEEAKKTKEQFVANVSHELRTPLNMIIGFSEMIMQTPKEIYGSRISSKLLADLDVILRNSLHLSKLIDDVLDLSQIEAGQMALSKSMASMQEIVHAAEIAIQPLFQSKGLFLNIQYDENLPPIYCDATRIRQVVLNLLSNAGRFTEVGGVTISVQSDERWMTVRVTDTGPGIEPSAKKQLFQPFHQMDSSVRSLYGGSGLGLSICKRFIEMHDGRIGFESEERQGTTFYFQLPLMQLPPPDRNPSRWLNPYIHFTPRSQPSLAPKPVMRQRFVVLEQGQTLHRLLSRYLDSVEVIHVESLPRAIEELEKVPTLALFINEAAIELTLHQVVEQGSIPHGVPIISCTISGIEKVADTMGVSSYLIKPISRVNLLSALDRLNLPQQASYTLLIADDEADCFRLFRRMLLSSEKRYNVLRAMDGEEALHLMREHHPDAVLMDLVMPKLNGAELLREKAKDPSIREIPIIVTSATDPTGHPIYSNSLAITQSGGLSVNEMLGCIQAISSVVFQKGVNLDPVEKEDFDDLPASE